jgi:hypothetical protein
MNTCRTRIETLEQRLTVMRAQTRILESQLRWWRGMAGGLGLLALMSLPLQSGSAAGPQPQGTAARLAALEQKLSAVTFDPTTNTLTVTGANLQVVNGLGLTATTNGLGNVIVGYNEARGGGYDLRTGSHTVVVGTAHNFSSYGGLVVGTQNGVSGTFAVVSGGTRNQATGVSASVSGGAENYAAGNAAAVTGGENNLADGGGAVVAGGSENRASGGDSVVAGGHHSAAAGNTAAVFGGAENVASGELSTVVGGHDSGATGAESSVVAGNFNLASGPGVVLLGGHDITR